MKKKKTLLDESAIVTFRLETILIDEVDAMGAKSRRTRSEMIRYLIDEAVAAHRTKEIEAGFGTDDIACIKCLNGDHGKCYDGEMSGDKVVKCACKAKGHKK
jgi:hypothetical protein